MDEKYTIESILEDDYGCEERLPNHDKMAIVILKNTAGEEKTIKLPDKWLYEENYNEGDIVYFKDGMIYR